MTPTRAIAAVLLNLPLVACNGGTSTATGAERGTTTVPGSVAPEDGNANGNDNAAGDDNVNNDEPIDQDQVADGSGFPS